MKTIDGSKQWTVTTAPDIPEDTRTDGQLIEQLNTDYFREHGKTARALCESMGLTFVGSWGATIERPTNNRKRPFGRIPFTGQHPDGKQEEFFLMVRIKTNKP
jgi:hypothetical protein